MKDYYIHSVVVLGIIAIVSMLIILNPPQEEQEEESTTSLIMTVIQAETEPVKRTEVKAIKPTEQIRYDVPLDKDIQDYIIAKSTEHHINPALVFAIIERESNYDSKAVGDGGNSIGLMQINTYWQQERMDKLGITDLFNPYENVDIGIEVLDEILSQYEDLTFSLMVYNGGFGYATDNINRGIYNTDYTEYVINRCLELQMER